MQQRRSEAFKLRRTRAYELAKEARTANIRNLNAKSNSSTKPEAKVFYSMTLFQCVCLSAIITRLPIAKLENLIILHTHPVSLS